MNQTVKIQRVAKSRGFGANPGKTSATKRALRSQYPDSAALLLVHADFPIIV